MLFKRSEMRDDDQTYLSSLGESVCFIYHRGRGHLLRFLRNRVKWHIYPRLHLLPSFPDHVDIEASSACNMRCPMCFTITEEYKTNVTYGHIAGLGAWAVRLRGVFSQALLRRPRVRAVRSG